MSESSKGTFVTTKCISRSALGFKDSWWKDSMNKLYNLPSMKHRKGPGNSPVHQGHS